MMLERYNIGTAKQSRAEQSRKKKKKENIQERKMGLRWR
jgi:hypothetical protein